MSQGGVNKRKRVGLPDEARMLIESHIRAFGLTANASHTKHYTKLANYFGLNIEEVRTFIRGFIKQIEGEGDENVSDDLPVELGSVPTNVTPNSSSHESSSSQTQELQSVLANLQEQLRAIQEAHQSAHPAPNVAVPAVPQGLQTVQASVDRFISKPTFNRKKKAKSAYDQYQKYGGIIITGLNREGKSLDPNYKSLNFRQWEDKFKRENDGKSLYQLAEAKETEEYARLWENWERESALENANGPRYNEIPNQTIARERKELHALLSNVLHKLLAYGDELQGCLYNVNTNLSKDVSTGEFGRKVSDYLSRRDETHPPVLFLIEVHRKSRTAFPGLPSITAEASKQNKHLRLRSQMELLKFIRQEFARLKKPEPTKVQVKKLLSVKGIDRVRLVQFPLTANRWQCRSNAECEAVLSGLTANRIKLELVADGIVDEEEDDDVEDERINDVEEDEVEDEHVDAELEEDEDLANREEDSEDVEAGLGDKLNVGGDDEEEDYTIRRLNQAQKAGYVTGLDRHSRDTDVEAELDELMEIVQEESEVRAASEA